MNLSIENAINAKLKNIFEQLGLDSKFATIKMSDRPELSDLQCNGALALAKEYNDEGDGRLEFIF